MRKAWQKKSEAEERAERVMRALAAGGALCWEQLQRSTHLNDDQLGMILTSLFEHRLIRTKIVQGTRIYLLCA